MITSPALLASSVLLLVKLTTAHEEPQHYFATFPAAWEELRGRVGTRLFAGVPFAHPCFNGTTEECDVVRTSYLDEISRSQVSGAYINTQWETCQVTGEQCLLDYTDPHNDEPILSGRQCSLGSISPHFIDVRDHEDVAAAFTFSRKTGIPVIVKNTGHDYKGRSSAPNSLAVWTHNLKNISFHTDFVAEGCHAKHQAITMGAGVQFQQLYEFADDNNVTVVGGSDRSVGASGGWLLGGGHGALSNTMGLGVDRVLQFKVVTPDGKPRTANACQNQDLFFALRGGGGAFGVVLESTVIATPRVTLQIVLITFPPNMEHTSELWSTMVDNSMQWAEEGWGAAASSNVAVYINPILSKDAAAKSMSPLINLGNKLKDSGVEDVKLVVTEFDSWLSFFQFFTSSNVAITGVNLALASRLINKGSFETSQSRQTLKEGLLAAVKETPRLVILVSAPSSFPGDGQTSVTEAWRDSLYHITVVSPWNWNATMEEKQGQYQRASRSMDNLRRITPDAAYHNEADVYEPNHEVSFWGENYERLLLIKKKYDPDHLLDCWQCVGWNQSSPRFQCYLPEGGLDNMDVNSRN